MVDVLVAAFYDYPVMRFVLRDSGPNYDRHINAMVGFLTDVRFARTSPVLAIRGATAVAAAALVDRPGERELPAPPADLEDLHRTVGDAAWERMVAFGSATRRMQPQYPHHFVDMIGVRPEHQGEGLARTLLQEIDHIAGSDPRSEAICLTTESENNLTFYQHLGYEIRADAAVDELHTWSLMKPATKHS